MKMTRLYPLALGGLLLPALLMPRLHSKTKARWWLPPVTIFPLGISQQRLVYCCQRAGLSDAGVTASDKLPRVLPGLKLKIAATCFFRRSRYAASLQPGLL